MANIKVFARPKLCQNACSLVRLGEKKVCIGHDQTTTTAPSLVGDFKFAFEHVFRVDTRLGDVFDVAAKDAVARFLGGCNGSIIAYGEAGSGKTYTLEGDGSDGLIPRSLLLVYDEVQKFQNDSVTISISFMEICTDAAYDLLGTFMYLGNNVKELPKVLITAGPNGSCHISQHVARTYQKAMKLHSLGKARRETLRQQCSDRSLKDSHTVFTVSLTRHTQSSEPVILRSKLHMVDLAGSQLDDNSTAEEQKHANVSIDHLEALVDALQKVDLEEPFLSSGCDHLHSQKVANATQSVDPADGDVDEIEGNVQHCDRTETLTKETKPVSLAVRRDVSLPYRNSLLTMVLQESLGGNSVTVVIATLLLGKENLQETISTCRFAQKVSRIVNRPIRNEKADMMAVITRLQARLAVYENPYSCRRSSSETDDSGWCAELMDSFINGRVVNPISQGVNTPAMFKTCLQYLRNRVWALQARGAGTETTISEDRDSGFRLSSDSDMESGQSNLLSRQRHCLPSRPGTELVAFSLSDAETTNDRTDEGYPVIEADKLVKPASPACTGTTFTTTQSSSTTTHKSKSSSNDEQAPTNEGCCSRDTEDDELTIMELELTKEALMQQSKTLMLALSDQQVRLVLLSRQGAVPLEVTNEKLAELQLQKRQRDVEQKLSLVVKQLADLNTTTKLKARASGRSVHACAAQDHKIKQRDARTTKELELKERATRQRLLARRQQLDKVLAVTPSRSSSTSRRRSLLDSGTQMKEVFQLEPRPKTAGATKYRVQTGQTGSTAASPREVSHIARKSKLKREIHQSWSEPNSSSISAKSRGKFKLSTRSACRPTSRDVTHDNMADVKTTGASEPPRGVCTVPDENPGDVSLLDYLYRYDVSLYRASSFPRRSPIDVSVVAPYSHAKGNTRLKEGSPTGFQRKSPTQQPVSENSEDFGTEPVTKNSEDTTANPEPTTENAERPCTESKTQSHQITCARSFAEHTNSEITTKNVENTSDQKTKRKYENTSDQRTTEAAGNTSDQRTTKTTGNTCEELTTQKVDEQFSVNGNVKEHRKVDLNEARIHQVRVLRVRRVLWAAQVIQGAWKRHVLRRSGTIT